MTYNKSSQTGTKEEAIKLDKGEKGERNIPMSFFNWRSFKKEKSIK